MFVANISISNEGLERFICHLADGGGGRLDLHLTAHLTVSYCP